MGNLFFNVLLKDKTKTDYEKIRKTLEKLDVKLGVSVDAKKLQGEIDRALTGKEYRVEVKANVDLGDVERRLREINVAAGGEMTPAQLRYKRAQEIEQRMRQREETFRRGSDTTAGDVRQQRILEIQQRMALRAAQAQQRLEAAQQRAAAAAGRHAMATLSLNKHMSGSIRLTGELRNQMAGLASIYAMENFAKQVVEIGGELEVQRKAVDSILQDTGKGQRLFNQVSALAVQSPFGVMELNSYLKQLTAYGVEYYELYDTLKRIADISAGVGVDMGRIILAYGQVRAAGFLKGPELRQFSEANINVVGALMEKYNKTAAEIYKMVSMKEVPFEDLQEVLWKLTDEGGQFANMQEELADTTKARWKNLSDAYQLMLADIAESTGGPLNYVAGLLTTLTKNWEYVGTAVASAVSAFGLYKVAQAGVNTVLGKGNATLLQNIVAMKQKQAEDLRMQANFRQLTAAEQGLIATSNRVTAADLRQLAVSGQLSKADVLRMVALRRLTVAQAGHLAQTLHITRAELAAAAGTTRWRVAMLALGASVRSVGVALKGLLMNPVTWLFTIGTALAEVAMNAKMKADEIRQAREDMEEMARSGAKSVRDALAAYEGVDPDILKGDELQGKIKELVEDIKNEAADANGLLDGVFKVGSDGLYEKSLTERYNLLLNYLKMIERVNEAVRGHEDITMNAYEATDGVFDERMDTNINDYIGELTKARKVLRDLAGERGAAEAVDLVTKKFTDFANKTKGMNMSEKVVELAHNWGTYSTALIKAGGAAESFQKKMSAIFYDNELMQLSSFKSIMENDMDTFFVEFENGIKAAFPKIDLQKPTAEDREMLIRLVKNFADNTMKDVSEDGRKMFENYVLNTKLHLNVQLDANFVMPKEQMSGWRAELDEIYGGEFTTVIKAAPDERSALEAIDKLYKEMKERVETDKPILVKLGFDFEEGAFSKLLPDWVTEFAKGISADFRDANDRVEAYVEGNKKLGRSIEETKKKTGGRKGSQKDTVAEMWKQRLALLQKAVTEYERWQAVTGKDEANRTLRGSGVFDALGRDFDFSRAREAVENFAKEIAGKARTKEQRGVVANAAEVVLGFRYDENKDELDAALRDVRDYVEEATRRWKLMDDILEATGNRTYAMEVAFGGDNGFTSVTDDIFDRIFDELERNPVGVRAYDLIDMNPEEVEKEYGQILGELVKAYKNAVKQREEAETGSLLKLLEDTKTFEEKRKEIIRKTEEEIALLRKYGAGEGAISTRRRRGGEELATLDYEQFKDSDLWKKAFGELDEVSSRTLSLILQRLIAFRDGVGRELPLKDFKELQKTIQEVYDEMAGRRPWKSLGENFDGLAESVREMKAARDEYKEAEKLRQRVQAGEKVERLTSDMEDTVQTEAVEGTKDGVRLVGRLATEYVSLAEAEREAARAAVNYGNKADEVKEKNAKLAGSIEGIADQLQAIGQMAGDIGSVFEGFGDEKTAAAMDAAQGVFDGAASMAKGVAAGLMGDPIGAVTGIVSGVTGLINTFTQLHDKKLDQVIEASENAVKRLQNVYDEIDRYLERSLGRADLNRDGATESVRADIARYDELLKRQERLREEYDRFRKSAASGVYSMMEVMYENMLKSVQGQIDKIRPLVEGYEEGGLYGYQRANLEAQLEELKKQRQAEEKKKNTDEGRLAELDAQIAELEDEIRYFAEDVASALYGIDVKEWASQIGDALTEAFEEGESAAEAFDKTVNDIMRELAKNMMIKNMLEPAFEELRKYLFGEDGKGGVFGKDFELDDSELAGMKQYLDKVEDVIPELEGFWDMINAMYPETGDEDASDNTISGQVASLSEETGNILAAYVNAMRSDVYFLRQLQEKMDKETLPNVNVVMQSQLEQLNLIRVNTERSAVGTEGILDLLNRVANGAVRLGVK